MSFFRKSAPTPPVPERPLHPYYPLETIIPIFTANDKATLELLTIFAGGCVALLATTWFVIGKTSQDLRFWDKMIILWFMLSGTIHSFFEGYFVFNHAIMAGQLHLFAQFWKEYAMSDSRYLTSDSFTLCMETITAVCWGPLCYVVAFCIARSHPLRYPLQAIVSLGQIYGDILYYATAMFDHYHRDIQYCRPEPYYFWFYYFFMNFIWIVIPGYLLYQSVSRTREAFAALDKMAKSLQTHGRITKPMANGYLPEAQANGHIAEAQTNGHIKSS